MGMPDTLSPQTHRSSLQWESQHQQHPRLPPVGRVVVCVSPTRPVPWLSVQMLASWQHQGMREISFDVADYPPAKSEALSMFAGGHVHASRVLALLEAARVAIGDGPQLPFPSDPLGLEVVLEAPTQPPSDATNYLGGIADALEAKGHRGNLEHLGDLAFVALYTNDRQIQEVHYRWLRTVDRRYRVRLWALQ